MPELLGLLQMLRIGPALLAPGTQSSQLLTGGSPPDDVLGIQPRKAGTLVDMLTYPAHTANGSQAGVRVCMHEM